jgi:hypothetical protein
MIAKYEFLYNRILLRMIIAGHEMIAVEYALKDSQDRGIGLICQKAHRPLGGSLFCL